MTEYATTTLRRGPLGSRPGPWTVLVVASAAVLIAAALLLAALWSTSDATSSTSYTAQLPGTLVGVELEVAEGDVEIVGGGGSEVLVSRVDSSAFGHWPTEERFINEGVLRIESTCPELVIGACSADYRITVPEQVPLRIVVEHGDIRLTANRESALLSTLDGSITVDAFCGPALDATAGGGDVDVDATCPTDRLTLRTGSGDISARMPPGQYNIDAQTLDGDVAIRGLTDDPASSARIQAFSNDGDVTVEVG